MSIFFRIWSLFTLLIIVSSYILLNQVQQQIKPNARQIMEESLADNANIISALLQDDIVNGQVQTVQFQQKIAQVMRRPLQGRIWSLDKNRVHQQLYITDANGIVIYDSTGNNLGKDYSRWNDVYLTLRGKYGARSTKQDESKSNSSVMYVAAPIIHQQQIIGVVSLAKPNNSLIGYIEKTERKLLHLVLLFALLTWLLAGLIAWHLSRNINQLQNYALSLAPAKLRPKFFMARELNQLTTAIAKMREELEDRAYVQNYVSSLTHELKSPLTSIKASAEILQEQLPLADQQRFACAIEQQSQKLQSLVERMLLLTRLEKQQQTLQMQAINPAQLWQQIIQQSNSRAIQQAVSIELIDQFNEPIMADLFWLSHVFSNLLDNALDFCPSNSQVIITMYENEQQFICTIYNQSSAIPDYALPQLFNRYFSLPRPTTGAKSTGIGLTLVQQVIELHHGKISIKNADKGVLVTMSLPIFIKSSHNAH